MTYTKQEREREREREGGRQMDGKVVYNQRERWDERKKKETGCERETEKVKNDIRRMMAYFCRDGCILQCNLSASRWPRFYEGFKTEMRSLFKTSKIGIWRPLDVVQWSLHLLRSPTIRVRVQLVSFFCLTLVNTRPNRCV